MKTWILAFCFILLCFLLPITLLLGNSMLYSYHSKTYHQLLAQNTDPSLSQLDRKNIGDAFYQGLTHQKSVQVILENGKQAFSQKEIIHMLDVAKLLRTLRTFTLILLGMVASLLWFLFHQKKRWIFSLPVFSLLVTILFVFLVMITFSSSFTLFHQLSFSNDFWLLDPTKDLLITLFPESFFVITFAKIGFMTLLELVFLFFGLRMLKNEHS
jgi:integral membrane protein (TIGR01906 family)